MSVTEHDMHVPLEGGSHETPQERHRMEHIALWLFIGGDAFFCVLEIFFWFYLRSLNTNGMWRGTNCSKANACTDGLGNPLTHPIAKAAAVHTLLIAVIMLASAAVIWFAEVQAREGATRKTTTPLIGLALLLSLGAIAYQIIQFQILPFTTIDGTYASTFEFFMGSNLAHFGLVAFIGTGLFLRSRKGKFENGSWYHLHLSRLWWVWIALSTTILAIVSVFFA